MKLNPDCIRDILFCVEEKTDFSTMLVIMEYSIPDSLSQYSSNEVLYHIKQAELSGLISVNSWYTDSGCSIKYLLPDGHTFLSNIREDTNWNKTKEIAASVGSHSLDVLKEIAATVVAGLIHASVGI